MIPILYDSYEKEFKTNGIGRLTDAISCVVTEQRNGIYELTLVYPITGTRYEDLSEGRIIYAIHDDTKLPQPFVIYSRSAPISGEVTFHAHHISYRLGNVILKPFTAGSCAEAFARFNANTVTPCEFTFWTDKETTGTFTVDRPVSIKEILGGTEGSILDIYGKAEYEWDKFEVKLHTNRGQEKPVQIRYGKNLSDILYEKDTLEMYSAVAPYWRSDEQIVMLPEGIITSSDVPKDSGELTTEFEALEDADGNALEYEQPIVKAVPLDLSNDFDNAPTEEQLRQKALQSLDGSYEPDENIEVDFVHLWQTDEYASVAPLQRCALCDKVDIFYPELGVIARSQQIIEVEYDCLLERYNSMTLGKARTSFAETVKASVEAAIIKQVPTKSYLDDAIDHATDMITGGLGGNVIIGMNAEGKPNEILIMDTDNVETAVNVWRFNAGGLGHSHSGYNGPFNDVALTADGKINASMITTGELTANIIKGGILTDLAGRNFWNLVTGEISISLDPGEEGEVTHADLQRVENNARTWSGNAETAAKSYTDDKLTDYSDNTALEGKFQLFKSGLDIEYAATYSAKGDTTTNEVRYYYQSTSPTEMFGGEWTTTSPTWTEGMYVWEKTRYIKGDGTYTESQAVCTTGNTGAGTPGEDGEDAYSLYITQDRASSTPKETPATIVFTAHVQRGEVEDIDPEGYRLKYAWFQSRDNGGQEYCGSGKTHTVVLNEAYCEDVSTLWFGITEEEFFFITDANGEVFEDANGNGLEVA